VSGDKKKKAKFRFVALCATADVKCMHASVSVHVVQARSAACSWLLLSGWLASIVYGDMHVLHIYAASSTCVVGSVKWCSKQHMHEVAAVTVTAAVTAAMLSECCVHVFN
jgi:hypothetical protein